MDILARFKKSAAINTSGVLTPIVFLTIAFLIVSSQSSAIINLAFAETGKGTDIFKVILTIFGVENTKGDVIALVTVNNGEESRVKFLETEAFEHVF
jgi:hypothetical protein